VHTTWLALNVHHWGTQPQARLLAGAVAPLLRDLSARGALRRVWSTRFDARGPHLFLLLGVDPAAAGAVRDEVAARVGAWLARHPSGEEIPLEERERRHAECRGKYLCPQDRAPGLAANNSWELAEQEPGGYPLWLFQRMAPGAEAEFWEVAAELFHWSVEQVAAGGGTRAALEWMAAVDAALRAAGADPAEAWRYHATTLLTPLQDRLRDDEAGVLAALPASVGERNRALFDRVREAGPGPWTAAAARRLVAAVLADDARTPLERWRALREVNHCTWIRLNQPVSAHVPLVLYAWQRSLAPAGAAGAA
jgi:hypothetical protein